MQCCVCTVCCLLHVLCRVADRDDHFSHTLGGDGFVLLLGPAPALTPAPTSAPGPSAAPQATIACHLNLAFVQIPAGGDHSACAAVYVRGVCCDPQHQGRGFAQRLLAEAVHFARRESAVRYIALRTMNLAIVKGMRRACGSAGVYPVDEDPRTHPGVQHAAAAFAVQFGWARADAAHLVVRAAYPACMVPVFKGSVAAAADDPLANRVDALIDRDVGDALVCIADLHRSGDTLP